MFFLSNFDTGKIKIFHHMDAKILLEFNSALKQLFALIYNIARNKFIHADIFKGWLPALLKAALKESLMVDKPKLSHSRPRHQSHITVLQAAGKVLPCCQKAVKYYQQLKPIKFT